MAKNQGKPEPKRAAGSAWTDEKIRAVLQAFSACVHNAAKKHGVTPDEVRDLIRDELNDPQ